MSFYLVSRITGIGTTAPSRSIADALARAVTETAVIQSATSNPTPNAPQTPVIATIRT